MDFWSARMLVGNSLSEMLRSSEVGEVVEVVAPFCAELRAGAEIPESKRRKNRPTALR